jgi:hypothetical protein
VTGYAQAFLSNDHSQLPLAREEKSTLRNMTKSAAALLMDVKKGVNGGKLRGCAVRRWRFKCLAGQGPSQSK